jgi:hypothetical protein
MLELRRTAWAILLGSPAGLIQRIYLTYPTRAFPDATHTTWSRFPSRPPCHPVCRLPFTPSATPGSRGAAHGRYGYELDDGSKLNVVPRSCLATGSVSPQPISGADLPTKEAWSRARPILHCPRDTGLASTRLDDPKLKNETAQDASPNDHVADITLREANSGLDFCGEPLSVSRQFRARSIGNVECSCFVLGIHFFRLELVPLTLPSGDQLCFLMPGSRRGQFVARLE